MEVAADAVEHLEFEGILGGGESARDHAVVVGGEGGVGAFGEEEAGEGKVVGVDLFLFGEGDFGGFLVGAFAEADGDAGGVEGADVGFAAEEVSLDDGADAAELGVEAVDDGESTVDVGGGFHVEFDAGMGGVGGFGEGAGVGEAEVGVDVEAELGEFDGNGGVELAGGEGTDGLQGMVAGGDGFFTLGDGFAEGIEGGEEALGVHFGADFEGFGESVAGDEAAGEGFGEGGMLHPAAELRLAGEKEEERSKQAGLSSLLRFSQEVNE